MQGLKRSPVRVTLVDRANTHTFQPLLYQVATGSLSPGQIAPPLRWVLRRQTNATVQLADVERLDLRARRVYGRTLDGGGWSTGYDQLVVAAGASHSYFGHDEWADDAPGLKTVGDALELRHRIFGAFELADVAQSDVERRRHLTFVVVGAGPTGVELAGQVVEIARRTLRREYRRFDPADARVVLVDAADGVLGAFDETLSERAARALVDMGIELRLGTPVSNVDARGVDVGELRIDAGTVIWAAGVQGSPLGALVAQEAGIELDRGGRVPVGDDFSVAGHPDVRVIGDLASTEMPGVAPAAMQQGVWVAKSIDRFERRREQPRPFRYKDKGSMATIGHRRAVAHLGGIRLSGTLAWLAWLFVHLLYVVGFANRVLVVVRWTASYIGRGRGRGERVLVRPEDPAPEG